LRRSAESQEQEPGAAAAEPEPGVADWMTGVGCQTRRLHHNL
jgi:hypothetical protein